MEEVTIQREDTPEPAQVERKASFQLTKRPVVPEVNIRFLWLCLILFLGDVPLADGVQAKSKRPVQEGHRNIYNVVHLFSCYSHN